MAGDEFGNDFEAFLKMVRLRVAVIGAFDKVEPAVGN